jgi:membrane associated rhomboid family serine protease
MSTAATIQPTTDPCTTISHAGRFRRHGNLWIWSAVLLLVNLPLAWGRVQTPLLFLPEEVIAGQWWRAIIYPLVHLSWYHLVLDAGGFLILFSCLEEQRKFVRFLYVGCASAGSLLLSLAVAPAISRSGLSGLSGIAHGLMAITAMEMLQYKGHDVKAPIFI